MKFSNKKIVTLILAMMLIASMAFSAVGCGGSNQQTQNGVQNAEVQNTETQSVEESQVTILGEGATQFAFTVVDKEGNETAFEIHTDKEIVGEALLELELIAGEEGQYGLYVKTVNGITADYDVDQTYWAFYVNGEYATSGVDTTPIEDGMTYTFKVEK
ncbi:MAG: DUF4430 domain-containing protein [Lachnospiraceae bacterium]|nr:DUF4430 domain-containing protein [Lachnospiraceae bacterium]